MNAINILKIILRNYFIPVLDIITMTFVIFYIYLFIQKSKAVDLAKGLLIILVVFFIMELIGFPVISWLFDKLLYNILLLIIILFSPEIRVILMNVGKDTSRILRTQKDEDSLQKIISSIIKLSSRKDGAIFVFARKDNLFDLLSSYVRWDAEVSEEVILFLFDKKSIFHDGAIIIDNNFRIKAVSAILPLTDAPADSNILEKHIGTRHRAGLGISEKSDAIAIVVSEETGHISIFDDGNPYMNIPAHNLKATLVEHLFRENEEETKIEFTDEDKK
ncbi:MAG: diadenylate cyclase CdaA [Exilispira sp.]